jgi:uridylate kinase
MASSALYRRVLLKISGEALMGDKEFGLDPAAVDRIAGEIASVHAMDVEVSVVIGGGNIFRGISAAAAGIELATAHHIGMLATVINALAMQNALEKLDIQTRVQSAIQMDAVCERYIRRRAARHMEKGRVVIFAAGTGNPFFTTDTGAALRAVEMNCDVMLKATQVDGVYTADPKTTPDAVRYDRLSYMDVLSQDLKVMDAAAISLASENRIPILVFSIDTAGAFGDILSGRGKFTEISDREKTREGAHHG